MHGIDKVCMRLLFITSVFYTTIQTTVVDNNQLVQWAETQGLGYKTANLIQLNQLAKTIQPRLPAGYQVQIPQFYGISAQQIEKALFKHDLNLAQEWGRILKTVTPEMHQTHIATPEFVKACEELAQKIEDKFSEAAYIIQKMPFTFKDQNKCWIDLASIGFDPEVASAIEDLVSRVALNKGLVTLRSTGLREDTEKVANAGGNESCEIVRATLAATVKDMGVVAASYLKAKSLQQRSGKDEKIFEQPQMPVLLQEVVGEHTGNPVISCVAYSQERQGNTKGVSSLQCNYGHGKSVVDSLFPIDTYYIDDTTKAVFPVIRVKTKRMVPHFGTTFELQEVDNSKDAQTKSSLDINAQNAIHIIMMELEKTYGRPMDVELVVDPIKKIVYLVQARPIVYETQKIKPFYVAEAVTFDANKIVMAQKIYVSGAVYFLKPDELLVTENLESALKAVLDGEAKQQQDPKVIVVKEPGAITSHAGATLAGKGIVLLQIDDTKPLENALTKKESSWLVDSQRGLIIDITGDERFSNQDQSALLSKGLLKEGWYSHPIPAVMSVEAKIDQPKVDAAIAEYAKQADSMPDKTTSDLLNLLKEAPEQQTHAALETILIRVAQEIDKLEQEKACKDVEATCKNNADQDVCKIMKQSGTTCFKEKTAEEAIKNLKLVFNAMLTIADDVKQVLNLPSRSMQRLLAVNFLEALLQQDTSSVVVNTLSLENVKKSYDKEIGFMLAKHETIDAKLFANRELLLIAQKGADAAPAKELEKVWITFISNLEKLLQPYALKSFIEMAEAIDSLGALPIWIYTRIVPNLTTQTDIATLVNDLLREFEESKPIMTALQEKKQQLITVDYTLWNDPQKFEANLKNLKKLLLYFTSDEFLAIFSQNKNQSSLAVQTYLRMLSIPIMEKTVEVIDTIIKTLKATPFYNNDTMKVEHFKCLLEQNLLLLKSWVPIMTQYAVPGYDISNATREIENLISFLEKAPLEKYQLEPSNNFDVRLATFRAKEQGAYSKPNTMEDFFTTIHQDLLEIISNLQSTIAKKPLPGLFGHIDELLRSVAMFISGSIDEHGTLKNSYIKKYIHHAISIELLGTKSQNITLTFNVDGVCPGRWKAMQIIAQIISIAIQCPIENMKENRYSSSRGSFRWSYILNKNSDLIKLPDSINVFWHIGLVELKASEIIPFIEQAFKQNKTKTLELLIQGLTLIPGFANIIAGKIEKKEIDEKRIFNWLSNTSDNGNKYVAMRKNSILSLLIDAGYKPALPIALQRIQNGVDDPILTKSLLDQDYEVERVITSIYNTFLNKPTLKSSIYFMIKKGLLNEDQLHELTTALYSTNQTSETYAILQEFLNAKNEATHNENLGKKVYDITLNIGQKLLSLINWNKPVQDYNMLTRQAGFGPTGEPYIINDLCSDDNDVLTTW